MKILIGEGRDELVSIDMAVEPDGRTCLPVIAGCGMLIEGPQTEVELVRTDDKNGLLMTMELPGITEAAILIEKEDIKKMKALMNKDAIKFMLSAFM